MVALGKHYQEGKGVPKHQRQAVSTCYVYIQLYMYICMYTCMYTCTHTHTHIIFTFILTQKHIHKHTHTYSYTFTLTLIHTLSKVKWYQKAADLGSMDAMNRLANRYFAGEGPFQIQNYRICTGQIQVIPPHSGQ